MYWAAYHNKLEAVELLLKRNVNAKTVIISGVEPVMYAVIYKNKKMMESLLEHGADPDAKTVGGCTPSSCSEHTHTETTEILKKYGAKDDWRSGGTE